MQVKEISSLKYQNSNKFQLSTDQIPKRVYDLEERTFEFAKTVAIFCKTLPNIPNNFEYRSQVIRSSGSTGSNYIEANEALGKKDFQMRIKICRKEAKESAYWLRLIIETNDLKFRERGLRLINEAVELKKIFSSMVKN